MVSAAAGSIQSVLGDWSAAFDEQLKTRLHGERGVPARLIEAVQYSALAPGKRLRPFLIDRSYTAAGGRAPNPTGLGIAVECLHAFTLIHDDLPAMDNADRRRGQPANHKVYGESQAILAGDALLAYGLELAAREPLDPESVRQIVIELAQAIGWSGVIGGQADDIANQKTPRDLTVVRDIHQRKTARLFQACCRVGALAAGADDRVFNNLSRYGFCLGQAFQIADDLLDVTADPHTVGKDTGRDADMDKQTYPAAVGVTRSRELGEQFVDQAIDALSPFGPEAHDLRDIARFIMNRTADPNQRSAS